MKCTECGRSFYWNYQAAGYSKPICFNCAEGKDKAVCAFVRGGIKPWAVTPSPTLIEAVSAPCGLGESEQVF